MQRKVMCVYEPDVERSYWYYVSSTGRLSYLSPAKAVRLIIKAVSEEHDEFVDTYILP